MLSATAPMVAHQLTLEQLHVLCNTGQGYHLFDVPRNNSSYNDLKIHSMQSGISKEW